ASGLSLLEELFPASEQRLELVARAPVSGERLDVAPVLREALLEVRDLGLEPGDPRLDSLELGRRLRLRRARRGLQLALGRRSGSRRHRLGARTVLPARDELGPPAVAGADRAVLDRERPLRDGVEERAVVRDEQHRPGKRLQRGLQRLPALEI